MTRKIHPALFSFATLIAAALAVLCIASFARAEVNLNEQTQAQSYQTFNFFTSTSTTATSTNLTGGGGYLKVAGAKRVTMYFSRAWHTAGNSGSSLFKVQVTPDGTNWYDYNKLVQNLATSTDPTTVSSVTISAATSTTIASLDLKSDTFYGVRCIVVETTDGSHTCTGAAEF